MRAALRPTLLLSALALACGSLSPLELVGEGGCTADDQCKGERICHQGTCLFPDEVGPDGGWVLDGGQWVPDGGFDAGTGVPDAGGGVPDAGEGPVDAGAPDGGGPAPGAVGSACSADTDCTDVDAMCLPDFPGGYCIVTSFGGGCPEGSVSLGEGMGMGLCVQACAGDEDCREGYLCDTTLSHPACLPIN